MRIALADLPGCGRSTIVNHIAGAKATPSNFLIVTRVFFGIIL
jgi:hypothetical protein